MVETSGLKDPATARDALDADTWSRVRALARASSQHAVANGR